MSASPGKEQEEVAPISMSISLEDTIVESYDLAAPGNEEWPEKLVVKEDVCDLV